MSEGEAFGLWFHIDKRKEQIVSETLDVNNK